jgi:hypothetical protein
VSARAAAGLASALAACALAAGCGEKARDEPTAPPIDRAAVATRFAQAIFAGDSRAAVGLLESPQALSGSVRSAAVRWRLRGERVQLRDTHPGGRFLFGFSGTQPHSGGRFDDLRCDLVVVVGRAAVEAFAFRNTVTKYRTHHDSQLLPSAR